MLLNGRMYLPYKYRFTLRKGGINPAIVIAFQFYAAIEKANGLLFVYGFFLVIG